MSANCVLLNMGCEKSVRNKRVVVCISPGQHHDWLQRFKPEKGDFVCESQTIKKVKRLQQSVRIQFVVIILYQEREKKDLSLKYKLYSVQGWKIQVQG